MSKSTFLSGLKANNALLASLYAQSAFDEMIALCRGQEQLYNSEVSSGVLGLGLGLDLGSPDRDRASNGLLLYLYHLSLAHSARAEFAVGAEVAQRFSSLYAGLPRLLQDQQSNVELHVQLRYNAGLALERAGQRAQAMEQLLAAAALVGVDQTVREAAAVAAATTGATGAAADTAPTVDADADADAAPRPYVALRSEVCSALGNLLTGARDFDAASVWHGRAVANEDLRLREPAHAHAHLRKWAVYHAAASCAAMKGEFAAAVALDSQALLLHQAEPRPYFNRGLCRQKLEQWADSIQDFSAVIALDPRFNHKSYVLRAKALLRQEEWAAVIKDCEAALALAPQDGQAKEFRDFAAARILQA